MDDQILIEKMQRVADSLSEKKGGLKLFALNWREDSKQWDILVGADWVDYDKLRDNISDIFQEVKKEFNGQYAVLFSGIHPLKSEEEVVQGIVRTKSMPSGTAELASYQIGQLRIDRMILLVSKA